MYSAKQKDRSCSKIPKPSFLWEHLGQAVFKSWRLTPGFCRKCFCNQGFISLEQPPWQCACLDTAENRAWYLSMVYDSRLWSSTCTVHLKFKQPEERFITFCANSTPSIANGFAPAHDPYMMQTKTAYLDEFKRKHILNHVCIPTLTRPTFYKVVGTQKRSNAINNISWPKNIRPIALNLHCTLCLNNLINFSSNYVFT